MTIPVPAESSPHPLTGRRGRLIRFSRRHGTIAWGGALLLLIAMSALFAPWIAGQGPLDIDPVNRMKPPSREWLFGTDALGRDLFSRTIHGGRISILVGVLVAGLATIS